MDSLQLGRLTNQAPVKLNQYLQYFGVSSAMLELQMAVKYQRLVDGGAKPVNLFIGDALSGVAVYRVSDFDSNILGCRTGKVDLTISLPDPMVAGKLVKQLIKSFKKDGLEYVTVRLSAADLVMIQALEAYGFQIVDGYVISLTKCRPVNFELPELPLIIRQPKLSDIPKLQKKIAPTFIYSRFFRDPVLNSEIATEMHSQWIANSLTKQIVEEAFVAEINKEPVGFITVEVDHGLNHDYGVKMGHIPLVGVDPTYRGKQISQRLTEYVINNWFVNQNVDQIRIETQLINYPAARSYEQSGFRIADSAVTLRWSKN